MNAQIACRHAAIRADMNAQFAAMHAEHAAIREQLNSVDRRTARIEGHLFGIEIPAGRAGRGVRAQSDRNRVRHCCR